MKMKMKIPKMKNKVKFYFYLFLFLENNMVVVLPHQRSCCNAILALFASWEF